MTPYRNAYRSPLGFAPDVATPTSPLGFGIKGSQGQGALPDLLTSLGLGLLMGKNPQQGLAYGLQQFQQTSGDRRQEQRQARRDQMDQQRYGLEQQKYQTEAQNAQAAQEQLAKQTQAFESYVNQMPVDAGVKQFILSQGPDSEAGKQIMKSLFPDPAEPPKSRTRDVGDKQVFEEWDPSTKTWKQVSDAPRWKTESGTGIQVDTNGDGNPDIIVGGNQQMKPLSENASQATIRGTLIDSALTQMDQINFENVGGIKTAIGGSMSESGPVGEAIAGRYILNDDEKKLLGAQGMIQEAVISAITGSAYNEEQKRNMRAAMVPLATDGEPRRIEKLKLAAQFMRQLDRNSGYSRLIDGATPPGAAPSGGTDLKSKYGLE